jgi:hypothetical protein
MCRRLENLEVEKSLLAMEVEQGREAMDNLTQVKGEYSTLYRTYCI